MRVPSLLFQTRKEPSLRETAGLFRYNVGEVVANCDHLQTLKFRPTLPFAFTEQGIGQLSTVVHSKIAIERSIMIMLMCHHENANDTRNDIKIVEIRACKRHQQRNCSITSDNIVFHYSIRFKVNKGLSGAPFFMPLRQHSTLFLTFVAYPPYRRNNSGKISPKFLESGQNRRTFASSIRQNKFWETQTRELIK